MGVLLGYVWTEAVTVKIFTRSQIYTGTCGRGLNSNMKSTRQIETRCQRLFEKARRSNVKSTRPARDEETNPYHEQGHEMAK